MRGQRGKDRNPATVRCRLGSSTCSAAEGLRLARRSLDMERTNGARVFRPAPRVLNVDTKAPRLDVGPGSGTCEPSQAEQPARATRDVRIVGSAQREYRGDQVTERASVDETAAVQPNRDAVRIALPGAAWKLLMLRPKRHTIEQLGLRFPALVATPQHGCGASRPHDASGWIPGEKM